MLDMHLPLFFVRARVHPTFWLVTGVLGYFFLESMKGGATAAGLAVWVVCMLLSVLFHELGHALMGMLFGRKSHIVLYWLGGLCIGDFAYARRWQRIAIALAGPGAGFVLYGLVYYFKSRLLPYLDPTGGNRLLRITAVEMLLLINLWMNLINLIPILPMDGGQALRELLTGFMPRLGLYLVHGLSVLLAGYFAYYCFTAWADTTPLWYRIFILVMLGQIVWQNVGAMIALGRERQQPEA